MRLWFPPLHKTQGRAPTFDWLQQFKGSALAQEPGVEGWATRPHSSRFSTSGIHESSSLVRLSQKSDDGNAGHHPRNGSARRGKPI
jgi:hypothetical protein